MFQVDDAGNILFTDDTTVQCIITTNTFIYIHAYIYVYIYALCSPSLFSFSLLQTMYSECFMVQDLSDVTLQG